MADAYSRFSLPKVSFAEGGVSCIYIYYFYVAEDMISIISYIHNVGSQYISITLYITLYQTIYIYIYITILLIYTSHFSAMVAPRRSFSPKWSTSEWRSLCRLFYSLCNGCTSMESEK